MRGGNSSHCLIDPPRLALMVILVWSWSASGLAQSVASGSIKGKVMDETGGGMPGVTVTLTSPALQVPQLVTVTAGEGSYQFVDLPAGLYRISYELGGFQPLVREDQRLSLGFVATINQVLKVGAVAESVTVVGGAPVVDVTSTAVATNLTAEIVNNEIPSSRTFQEIMAFTPGAQATGLPDLGGGSTLIVGGSFESYGSSGQITNQIEGINTRQGVSSPGSMVDFASMSEMQVETVGADAETALPGVSVNLIIKSGGNDFHGMYNVQAEHSRFQNDNLSDEIRAQGVNTGEALKYYLDSSADLGGRIIRDKLWFYGALRDIRTDRGILGFSAAPGADGRYGTIDDEPSSVQTYQRNETIKLSYQPSRNYKIVYFYGHSMSRKPQRDGTRLRPLENSKQLWFDPAQYKAEFQATPSSQVLFNVVVGNSHYDADYFTRDEASGPARLNRETGIQTGPAIDTRLTPRDRWQASGGLTLFPDAFLGGRHEFKLGFNYYREYTGSSVTDHPHGNYELVYDRIGGVSDQPTEIRTYNYPTSAISRGNEYGVYAKDTWRVGQRLTLNLGIRWDGFHSFLPPQEKVQGQFGTAGSFPLLDVRTWRRLAPRLGGAFDLTGDGKTVVKATYGFFNHSPGDDFAAAYNQNAVITATYRWRDTDGNNDYTPGEVNLNTNGPDFVSISGAANNVLNPDIKGPYTHEIAASVERELMRDFSARVTYVYKSQIDLIADVNILRPYSAWNIALNRRDPGPDGLLNTGDDAGRVTVYDYDPAFRGSQFVGQMRQNRPSGREDRFQTIDLALTKRAAGRWSTMTSLMLTKNHRWLTAIAQSPNDDYFPVDDTWEWVYRTSGTVDLFKGIRVSANLQVYNGVPGQRTNIFRNVDPDGGAALGAVEHSDIAFGAVWHRARADSIPPEPASRQETFLGLENPPLRRRHLERVEW